MIDWQQVHELRHEVGAEDFGEIIRLFLNEAEEALTRLKCASAPQEFEADLHFLKGGALSLGFDKLRALCEAGEQAARQGRTDQIDLDLLVGVYKASKRAFLSDPKLTAA